MKIYLDHNATTPLAPSVATLLKQEIDGGFGNPSSVHAWGRDARNKITKARRQIAEYFKVRPGELIFTSSATEAVNLVLRSLPKGRVITSTIDHACVYETAKLLPDVVFLKPSDTGSIDPQSVKNAIIPGTSLIILSAVNSETGVMNDIEEIGRIALAANVPFFVDAAQIIGKESFSPPPGVEGFCISGHKFHAPKGIGALWLSPKIKLAPLMTGGGQEYNKRAGTENVLGIVAMAEAVRLLAEDEPFERIRTLRDHFEAELGRLIPGLLINGTDRRVSNTSNVSFPGQEGEAILMNLDMQGIAASHGSACSSGSLEPSRVLLEMGFSKDRASSSVRFSFSRYTTKEEIAQVLRALLSMS